MVHFVKVRKKLPTGDTVRCEVCRDGGMAYHRTTVEGFRGMVDDMLLNPLVCEARVLSFSRKRDQSYGGRVLLVFHEKSLPGKREMCYAHPDDYEKVRKAQTVLQEAIVRTGQEEVPVTRVQAYLGVTRFGYRKECEVMARGCLPLDKILKVEYWLSTSCEPDSPLLEMYNEKSSVSEITRTGELAARLEKPFEVKSCHPALKWVDNGTWVWATLDHKTLTGLAKGEWPKSEGVSGIYGSVRWNRTKPIHKCKCRPAPQSVLGFRTDRSDN